MREYDKILHYFLETIQRECPELILEFDDVYANYVSHVLFIARRKEELVPLTWTWNTKCNEQMEEN
jgi:hypothetical protein